MRLYLFFLLSLLVFASCSKEQPADMTDASIWPESQNLLRTVSNCTFPCMNEEDFDITGLPSAITDYITENYPGTTITEAEVIGCHIEDDEHEDDEHEDDENEEDDFYTGSLDSIAYFEVELGESLELLFEVNGTFIAEQADDIESKTSLGNIPGDAAQYVAENYGSLNVEEVYHVEDFGFVYYEVELDNGVDDDNGGEEIELSVIFNDDGTFLCEKNDD